MKLIHLLLPCIFTLIVDSMFPRIRFVMSSHHKCLNGMIPDGVLLRKKD